MKRCPQCHSSFPDTNQFCELDGNTLVAEYSDLVDADRMEQERLRILAAASYPVRRRDGQILALVAVAGMVIAVALFLIYYLTTRQAEDNANEPSTNSAVAQQQIPALRPVPVASPSPSPEPSPSPSPTPSPAVEAQVPRLALSSGEVSTGENEKARPGQVTIRLTNGTSLEADEAWETGEGIWYRRRGVVALLPRDQVKMIEKASEKASPAATPTSSPTASP